MTKITKRTGVRFDAEIFDRMKSYCALMDIGFSAYIASGAIKQFLNDTAQGVRKNENQKDEHEDNAI